MEKKRKAEEKRARRQARAQAPKQPMFVDPDQEDQDPEQNDSDEQLEENAGTEV